MKIQASMVADVQLVNLPRGKGKRFIAWCSAAQWSSTGFDYRTLKQIVSELRKLGFGAYRYGARVAHIRRR